MLDKLVSVFRSPLVPLYSAYTDQSLNAASAILNAVLGNIRSCSLNGDNQDIERQSGWERVANALLSGVIVRGKPTRAYNTSMNSFHERRTSSRIVAMV